MYPILKKLLNSGAQGSIAGIIISLFYMIASNGTKLHIPTFLYNILFGTILGFLIGFFFTLTENFFKRAYAKFGKPILIAQILSIFFFSGVFFFFLSYGLSKLFTGYFPPYEQTLQASIWTGIASVVGSLIFGIIDAKEEKLQLEKANRAFAINEERNRIARELHDSVSQNLFGISLNLKTLDYLLETDTNKSKSIVTQLDTMVQEVQTEMRLLIYELRPISFDNTRLFEALENLAGLYQIRYNLNITCEFNGNEDSFEQDTKIAFYRILQEALNNIVKHANSSNVFIYSEIYHGKGTFVIKDDGKGFDLSHSKKEGSLGLQNMKERAKQIGASLELDSSIGKGTMIKISF